MKNLQIGIESKNDLQKKHFNLKAEKIYIGTLSYRTENIY